MKKENQKTVLVVDDEPDARNYLRSALEEYGFRVKEAANGFEALEIVKKEPPDLISLDLVMPKHSGAKFYRELQKNKLWAKIPVLIVTGHARDEWGKVDFDSLVMQGPGVYLEKPVKPKNYIEKICFLLKIEPPKKISEFDENEDPETLKRRLADSINFADPDTLKEALRLINQKKKEF